MPKNKIIITLGVIIALLPVLGFPRAWEDVFQVMAGLSIVLLSVWTIIDKRLTMKAKARMRQARKKVETEEPVQETVPSWEASLDEREA